MIHEPGMRKGTALITVLIVAAWLVAACLVDPRAEVPLLDDWIYAASVEGIQAGRGFAITSWSSTVPVAQIWWGVLWVGLAGFSFTALRLSTLLLAAAGSLVFFALLRALGIGTVRALLGVAALLTYPVAFVLSFTFMTDVPFLVATLGALWALAVALRDGRLSILGVGLAGAITAFLIRPVAIAVPAALLVATLRLPPSRFRCVTFVLGLVSLAAMAASAIAVGRLFPYAGEGGLAYRIERLHFLFLVPPIVYLQALGSLAAHVGLAALPVVVATAPSPRRWPWRAIAVMALLTLGVSFAAPEAVSALKPNATWSTIELGAARPLLLGSLPLDLPRRVLAVVATAIGLLGALLVLARLSRRAAARVLGTPAWTLVLAFGVISLGLCFVLWFFYDRYYLPLVPVAIALALVPVDGMEAQLTGARASLAAGLLLALAILDVTGVRDMLAHARAVREETEGLLAVGVRPHQIDAGYPESGWRLHAHPENLPPGARLDHDVPHVTSAARMPFVIANTPLPGYRVREERPVPVWWAEGDRLYVLEDSQAGQ